VKNKRQDTEHLAPLAQLDKLIHEPARLLLLSHLYVVEETDFLFLERQTGMTRGNLSTHLSKLEAGSLVEIEKGYNGKIPRTVIRMTPKGREAFADYLQQMKGMIDRLVE
jgi:DNA-binding MarR family transcriptional regulator